MTGGMNDVNGPLTPALYLKLRRGNVRVLYPIPDNLDLPQAIECNSEGSTGKSA